MIPKNAKTESWIFLLSNAAPVIEEIDFHIHQTSKCLNGAFVVTLTQNHRIIPI